MEQLVEFHEELLHLTDFELASAPVVLLALPVLHLTDFELGSPSAALVFSFS
jgi:hypothetical protein